MRPSVTTSFAGIALTLWLSGPLVATCTPPAFTDVTDVAGLGDAVQVFPAITGGPSESVFETLRPMLGGGAAADFNRDGWPDLFVLGGGGVPDRLYLNRRDGTFVDQAAAWGVDRLHVGAGIAVGDIDADGWPDAYITSMGPPDNLAPGQNLLYRNTGSGTFEEIAASRGVATVGPVLADGMGATFGDIDRDGDLDLFVAGYLTIPPDDNFSNRLYRNDGVVFTDITDEIIGLGGLGGFFFGFSPRFVDMNEDRVPDLLIAADFQAASGSHYLAAVAPAGSIPGISFVNVTAASGTGLDENGMGHAVADINGDGRLDWYVTSIFQDSVPDQTGNKLYLAGDLAGHAPLTHRSFTEVAAAAGVDDGGWAWGTLAIDVNHDGRVDLLSTNGWTNGAEFQNERTDLFLNTGTIDDIPVFEEVAAASGIADTGQGRGLVDLDYDRDGDRDVIVFNNAGPLHLYRNDINGPQAHWLSVTLDTDRARDLAPNGIGSLITVQIGDVAQVRAIDAGATFLSQAENGAHFGIGAASRIDVVRVDWARGRPTLIYGVPSNRHFVVSPDHADVNGDGCVDELDLAAVLDARGKRGSGRGHADLNGDRHVDGHDVMTVIANFDPACRRGLGVD